MGDFIREQIKEKPLSKKRILTKIGISALCGLVFGVVACAVFAAFYMTVGKQNQRGDTGAIAIDSETETQYVTETEPESETETETETEYVPVDDTETVSETETEAETETVPETETETVKEFTIEDYQKIQNKFYEIGTEAGKSIVSVTAVRNNSDWFNNTYDSLGTSAGVIVSITNDSVYVLTEKKSVNNARAVFISFDGEEMYEATLNGQDGNTGIAVLKVDAKSIPKNILADIDAADIDGTFSVYQGLITIAIGTQFDSSTSILSGTITSSGLEVAVFDKNYRILTTDIIGSTNGSGVLINTDGNVIGFIRQDFGISDGTSTIKAIDISELKPVIDKLVAGEQIPYLGTIITVVTDTIAREYDLPKGIYVREAKVDSPVMVAGIQSGDVITKINNKSVTNAQNYYDAILKLDLDSPSTITFMRQGANGYTELECEVTPGVIK